MKRFLSPGLLGLIATWLAIFGSVRAEGPTLGADDWMYDKVHLKNGQTFVGLVLEETPRHVLIQCVSRKPGSPTIVYKERFQRREVKKVVLLGPEDRDQLHKRLQTLAQEREQFLAQLKQLDPSNPTTIVGENVSFRPSKWVDDKTEALQYDSTYFVLITNAREDIARLAVLLLESVYTAYTRSLPPRTETGKPTTILLTATLEDYQQLVRDRGIHLANPAFYDVDRNQIVCGSDLQHLSEELVRIRTEHTKLITELEQRKRQLRNLYRDNIPQTLLLPILEAQKKIAHQDRTNTATFKKARERLFQRLYHEAFHAYLANFVYPAGEGQVPRWFNEGLAQVFETAIVEVGELRVGHAPKDRIDAVRAAIARNKLLPLEDLLRSDAKQFLAFHNGRSPMSNATQISNRYYLSSWALASFLAFDRKLLGSSAMDQYVRSLQDDADPVVAFREFVGQPLDEVQKGYLTYLKDLKPPNSSTR